MKAYVLQRDQKEHKSIINTFNELFNTQNLYYIYLNVYLNCLKLFYFTRKQLEMCQIVPL